jgi:hypothetical protein
MMQQRSPTPRWLLVAACLAALWFTQCSDDPADAEAECVEVDCPPVSADAADAGEDATIEPDTRADTRPDTRPDAGPDAPPDVANDTSADAAEDVASDTDAQLAEDADAAPQRIRVPAVDTTKSLAARVLVDGQGSTHVGGVDIADSVGSVTIDGRDVDALVYKKIPWEGFDRTLYQTLAVSSDALHVLWFYCDDADQLREIWLESTDGLALDWEQATGSCSSLDQAHSAQVSFPAVDWPLPQTVDDYEVSGQGLDIGPQTTNTATLGGTDHRVFVFEDVDCSTECGVDGWYELHALLWDRDAPRVYFGIFYLYPDSNTVQLEWLIALPGLTEPGSMSFAASWSRR